MLYSSDYHSPGANVPNPGDLPNQKDPPLHDPSEEPVAPVPDEEEKSGIKLPEDTDRDLTRDFPDTEDNRRGRKDPNIREEEEIEDG